ncbi:hypothetical protein PV11_05882 [Exophiala sideris]|uniref:Aminotransferase class I/classII large domain-containing protein n=1 Tax=Exophiala sideris TaxID=1016849 RepID=A0A0D1YM08_9EURO|nr:hypothetical protein PV11_05882 [Exophiala sideris]
MSSEDSKDHVSLKPKPLSLTHHFSRTSLKRVPNVLKEYYKFLREPEMGNLAGGLPFTKSFPFNTLELSVVDSGTFSTSDSKYMAAGSTPRIHIPRTSQSCSSVRKIDLDTALQYGGAQGYPPLYAWLKKLTNVLYHPNIPYEGGADVMIDGGSADGLSKIYEVLFDHWDGEVNDVRDRQGLIVEEFVYAPPVASIQHRDVNIVPVRMDSEGMLAYGDGSLSDVLRNWDPAKGKRPHALYIIPTGQNPTSGVLSFQRRKEIYELCSEFDLILIEDDPYWNLYYPSAQAMSMKYRGVAASANFPTNLNHNYSTESLKGRSTGYQFLDELIPSFLSIDVDGRVIRLDTFSKTIAPGCRLGWITAQPSICEQIFRVTDGTTQQPSGFVQVIVAQLLGEFGDPATNASVVGSTAEATGWGLTGWVRWLEGLRSTYERRMIKMATIFEEHKLVPSQGSQTEMYTFSWPMGGMFIWLKINIFNHPLITSVDPKRLMFALWVSCTQRPYRVLTCPGGDFAANKSIKDAEGYLFLRFCFAAVDEDVLEDKSRSFIQACQDFWAIKDPKYIDHFLREEDAMKEMTQAARDTAEVDREVVADL